MSPKNKAAAAAVNTAAAVLTALILFMALGISFAQQEPQVEITAKADKDIITIGEKIRYTILITAPGGTEIEIPDLSKALSDFTIRDFNSSTLRFTQDSKKQSLGKNKFTLTYILDTYATGKKTIPAVVIKCKEKGQGSQKEISTQPIEINVESVLAKEKHPTDIRDIKGPIGLGKSPAFYLLWAFAMLLSAAAIIWGWRFFKKRVIDYVAPPRLAHEIAYEQLARLKEDGLIKKGMIKEFYIRLSDIVRRYIEKRFAINAPDMSTEEFLARLKDSDSLAKNHKGLLKDFLQECDLVKFAKYGPENTQIDSSFDSAKKFVDETKVETRFNGEAKA